MKGESFARLPLVKRKELEVFHQYWCLLIQRENC